MMADDQVVVVTGATSGIGRSVVSALQAKGAKVAALSRSASSGAWGGPGVTGYGCDVTDAGQVRQVVKQVEADFGRIDGLVNSAGVLYEAAIGEGDASRQREQFAVNVGGLMAVSEACLGPLRRTAGAIVNISSVVVERPRAGLGIYAATKGAIEAYSRAMALELGASGIRVNVVRPGTVRSNMRLAGGMSEDEDRRVLQRAAARLPLGRAGDPEDVAGAVVFLLSDQARWITGAVLAIDGGRSGAT